jgi:hypothetical protein
MLLFIGARFYGMFKDSATEMFVSGFNFWEKCPPVLGGVWQDSSACALSHIYGRVTDMELADYDPNLGDLRECLDGGIRSFFDKPSFPSPNVERFGLWRELGALGVLVARKFCERPMRQMFVHETLVRKQTDYGHENIARFGAHGLLVRMHDKVARLENIVVKGADPKNESLFDNFMDVVGYSAIGCMWEVDEFLLPLGNG